MKTAKRTGGSIGNYELRIVLIIPDRRSRDRHRRSVGWRQYRCVGCLFFGKNSVDLIAIDPNTDLQMTINQNLLVSLK